MKPKPKPITENFYVYNSSKNDFFCVHAERIEIRGFADIPFYIHHVIDSNGIHVTDRFSISLGITGITITSNWCRSVEAAKRDARRWLDRYSFKLEMLLLNQIRDTGYSPSFLDEFYAGTDGRPMTQEEVEAFDLEMENQSERIYEVGSDVFTRITEQVLREEPDRFCVTCNSFNAEYYTCPNPDSPSFELEVDNHDTCEWWREIERLVDTNEVAGNEVPF